MYLRKTIGLILFALSGAMTLAISIYASTLQGFYAQNWDKLVGLVIIIGSLVATTLIPQANGQYRFNFKTKRFGWRNNQIFNDVGNYQYLLRGSFTFWLTGTWLSSIFWTQDIDTHWSSITGPIFIALAPIEVAFCIYLMIRMYYTGGGLRK